MALIKCKGCGRMVSDQAEVCPQCGIRLKSETPEPQPSWGAAPQYHQSYPSQGGNKNTLLYIIIAALVVIIVAGVAYFFITANNNNKAEIEELKKSQKELASANEKLSSQNQELEKKTARLEQQEQHTKIIVQKGAEHASEHRAVSVGSKGAKVVINGTGVRLRFAPSLDAGYLTWENGATRAPKKGAILEFRGEDGDWYEVRYLGHTFYVSKEYSYLEF